MDRDTAVARIQQKLGFRTDLVTQIQNALQDAQDELERGVTLPWFLNQLDQTFTITPSNPVSATPQEYNLPTGFIKDMDEIDGTLRYQQSTPGPQIWLKKLDYQVAEQRFFGRTDIVWDDNVVVIPSEDTQFSAGTPIAYVVRSTKVRIYPGPDQNYNLLWSYIAHDTALNGSNTTNQWLTYAPWLLIGQAGQLISADARDTEAYDYFCKIVEGDPQRGTRGARKDFLALVIEREVSGRSFAMGSRL